MQREAYEKIGIIYNHIAGFDHSKVTLWEEKRYSSLNAIPHILNLKSVLMKPLHSYTFSVQYFSTRDINTTRSTWKPRANISFQIFYAKVRFNCSGLSFKSLIRLSTLVDKSFATCCKNSIHFP